MEERQNRSRPYRIHRTTRFVSMSALLQRYSRTEGQCRTFRCSKSRWIRKGCRQTNHLLATGIAHSAISEDGKGVPLELFRRPFAIRNLLS